MCLSNNEAVLVEVVTFYVFRFNISFYLIAYLLLDITKSSVSWGKNHCIGMIDVNDLVTDRPLDDYTLKKTRSWTGLNLYSELGFCDTVIFLCPNYT